MYSNCYGKRQNLIRKQSIFPSTAFAWDDLPFSSRLTHPPSTSPPLPRIERQNRTVKLFKNFKNVPHPHSQVCWGGFGGGSFCIEYVCCDIIIQYCRSIIQMMWKNRKEKKHRSRREVAAAFELSGGARVYVGVWILKWRRWKMENLWNLWMLFSDNNT